MTSARGFYQVSRFITKSDRGWNSPRAVLASVAGAIALLTIAPGAARADVPLTGSFVATEACPAFQSFRKSTNPGDVKIEPNQTYQLIAKNKPDATHYRIIINGAEPEERWVSGSCGHIATGPGETQAPSQSSPSPSVGTGPDAGSAKRATHVLAMGWEPTFCEQHSDKTECRELSTSSYAATHLSLHGLWPQPRGTQYCNVPAAIRETDDNHDWNDLPEPELSPDTLKHLSEAMPGVQSKLERHEWIVHGTCFGTSADVYFTRAADLADAVNASKVSQVFADNVGKFLSADAIRAAFDASFGAGAGARVTISCHGRGDSRKITELVINLAGNVKGSDALSDLIKAAPAVPASCPGGLVEATAH
ncbi:MAG: ribonuclease T [Hyphomicrobium sp.]|uniref:ribonuclease T2 family protein n=1 Tax=Hyphomicrobium sp. TaxID=82 RepID=UPI0039E57566